MAAWAVIEDQKKILMIRRSDKTSRSGQWCFPGGGIKVNESAEEACVREAKEETSLDVKPYSIIANIANNFYFRCYKLSQEQKVDLKLNECDKHIWIEPCKLLRVGIIMDFKKVYQVLSQIGYEVELNDEVRKIIS